MDGFAVYFHTTTTIFTLFTHTYKASRQSQRAHNRETFGTTTTRQRTTTTMRTSMTVGGAGATTERELGELKVRLRPRRRSMGSVDDDDDA